MKRLLLGAAVAALSTPTWAQDINQTILDEDIITVTDRIGYSSADRVTAPVTVLTESEIQARSQGVLADLLRTVPGLSVSQNGGAGSLTQIRLRGSEANHVVVIIDGVEVANPNDGAFDFGGLRTKDIIKIEVLRGEQSALYGSDAVGGVINIITRAGETREFWSASIEGGSRDTLEGQFSAGVAIGDNAVLTLNGNLFTTDGFDVSGLDGETDGAESRALNIGLNNVVLGPVTLSGKFGTQNRETEFDGDTDFDGRLNNTDGVSDVTTETARVDARFSLAGFDHKLTAHMVETETDTAGGFSSHSVGSRHVANWAAKQTFAARHTLTLLGEAEHEQYSITPNFTEADAKPDNWTYGLAGDYRYAGNALTLSLSARHDFNDLFDDATTWRVGAGYGFDWNGRVRASFGTGVKNPTLIELFGFFPASNFTGNPNLQPETSRGISIGYEQRFATFNFSVDYFRSELEDEITTLFNIDFTTSVINLDTDSTRSGIELAADWQPVETVIVSASASFLDSEENDVEEIRRPNVLASATVNWQASERLNLNVSADYNGEQLDTDFATFSNVTLDDFLLVGAKASYQLNDFAALSLRGTNLLDDDYQEIVGYASPGRAVFAGLALDF